MHQPDFFKDAPRPPRPRPPRPPREFKLVALRDCPEPSLRPVVETPQDAADYWHRHVTGHPYYSPDCECLVALLLTVRHRVLGHHLVSVGILNEVMAHPREVFRAAIVGAAHAVLLMHNHPSGDPQPSDADVRLNHTLVRAGQLLRIEVLDHIVVGHRAHASLRELGHFGRC